MRMKKILTGVAITLSIIIIGAITAPIVLERVDAGEYKIVQKLNGDLIVLSELGWQYTGLTSAIDDYREADVYYFSDSDLDGGNSRLSSAVEVIFRDGAKGRVNGNFQFKLPISDDLRIQLHKLYGRDYEAVVHNLIRKSISESILSSATYFKGEEAYSYGKSDFISMIKRQAEEGIFANIREQKIVKDAEDNKFMENIIKIKYNEDGVPVINKTSKLKEFNVMNIGLTIEKIQLDDKTMAYIEKKKDAEFEKIQKQSEAEKAKQDAITAEELGKANVARAKYKAEVAKQTAVTNAEKSKAVAELKAQQEFNVAKLNRQKANEEAKALLVKKEAEARANELLVKAGLTPREKAEIDKEKAIGVARELAKAQSPGVVVSGGTGEVSPMSAVGIKYLMDINDKLTNQE